MPLRATWGKHNQELVWYFESTHAGKFVNHYTHSGLYSFLPKVLNQPLTPRLYLGPLPKLPWFSDMSFTLDHPPSYYGFLT